MKTFAKIIYTVIVCRFLIGIRERLMTRPSLDTTHCLLIEYRKDANEALLFGYAKRPQQLRNLLCEMRKNGFAVVTWTTMAMVYPLGNGMFRYIGSEKCIGPVRLRRPANGRWCDIAKKFGMKAEVIDSMCAG